MKDNTTNIKIALLKNDTITFLTVANELEEFQALVGGFVERWGLRQSADVFFNEDGLRLEMPPNELANYILPLMYSERRVIEGKVVIAPPFPVLVGPVLVVGTQEPDGQPDGECHSLSRRIALDLCLAWLGRPTMGRIR